MSTTWINRGHFYVPHVMPVLVDCNFIVDSSNGNGLGIRSLKGQGVQNVFMHTSATPGKGQNGQLNPNPAAGNILVQFSDNFQRYYGGFNGYIAPLSGSPVTSTTAGVAYVITSLGTASAAQWLAAGVPPGVIPAVGVSFVAIASASIGGSASVDVPAPGGSNIDHIEVVGDPNKSLGPVPVGGSPNVGAWLLLACQKADALTAPANGTVISLASYFSQASVFVAGE